MALAVGDSAPDFTLVHKLGSDPVQLSKETGDGPVVLLFFPLAFSSVCTDEMCHMADTYSEWSGLGATVFGISVDSPFVNAKFAAETQVAFPLLSDFNKETATAYGVRNDDFFGMKGVANRSAFVVDDDGRIAYAWVSEDPGVMPPFEKIKAAVEAA